MRLLDDLRNAEQKGVNAMRRGMGKAREQWSDMERRIRQRMRVYPQKLNDVKPSLSDFDELDLANERTVEPERKPIVSIHGRDVKEGELGKTAA
jgi:hypothetical protein